MIGALACGYSSESTQRELNTNRTGFRWFALDESSLSTGSFNVGLLMNLLLVFLFLDITNIYKAMHELELLAKTVIDILDCRIEATLQDMSLTALCDLPDNEPVTVEEFLRLTENICSQASEQLAK